MVKSGRSNVTEKRAFYPDHVRNQVSHAPSRTLRWQVPLEYIEHRAEARKGVPLLSQCIDNRLFGLSHQRFLLMFAASDRTAQSLRALSRSPRPASPAHGFLVPTLRAGIIEPRYGTEGTGGDLGRRHPILAGSNTHPPETLNLSPAGLHRGSPSFPAGIGTKTLVASAVAPP